MPLFNIYVSAEGRDLGGVLADVEKVAKSMEDEIAPQCHTSKSMVRRR